MDNAGIASKESHNTGFIDLVQIELPIVQPVTEPADRIHLHRRRRWQEALLFNLFQVSIEMRSQWPHTKSLEKLGIKECLHLPRMVRSGCSELCRIAYCRYLIYSGQRSGIRHNPGFGIAPWVVRSKALKCSGTSRCFEICRRYPVKLLSPDLAAL